MIGIRQHILVIEHNADLHKLMIRTLKLHGFLTSAAVSGHEGIVQYEAVLPDLIILNVALPDITGVALCQHIRESSHVPIMAIGTDESKAVEILNAGADDYLTAPFDEKELLARMKSLLRRSLLNQSAITKPLRIGDLVVNPATQELSIDGHPVRLSKTEWALLNVLISNAGKVVTRRALVQKVWGVPWDEHESNLRVTIARLRSKLEVDPTNPVYLRTEPGIGYYFAGISQSLHQAVSNLPAQNTSFIGRDSEITALKQLILRPDSRLITLTGPGGSGKTRIALQLAANVIGKLEDGVQFVALATVSQPELLGAAILQALKLKETSGESGIDQLTVYLTNKQMLLILDNFEQIVASSPFIAALLEALPHLKILVTSRIPLHLMQEHEYKIPPMPTPNLQESTAFEVLSTLESIQLFVERTKAIKPNFILTSANIETIAAICARLDGLPLVIELAAARMNVLSPESILERLSNRLSLLTTGERDRPERHRTLQGTLDWSYDLLNEASKSLFSQLAVFTDSYNLEAIEAVCWIENKESLEIVDSLVSLLDNNMLQQQEIAIADVSTEYRYSMLETIHEYAARYLLESGSLETIQRRHAIYYLKFIEAAKPHLLGAEQQVWLDRIEYEHRNLQLATQWALDHNETDITLRFYASLGYFWLIRGYQSEGRRWISKLPKDEPIHDSPLCAEIFFWAGWLAYDQNDFEEAHQIFTQGLALSRKHGDKLNAVRALHGLGELASAAGDQRLAVTLYEESLTLAREIPDKIEIAWTLMHIGGVAHKLGDYTKAIAAFQESLTLFREANHLSGTAHALHTLGASLLYQGDLEAAKPLLDEGLILHQSLGQKPGVMRCLLHLGEIALQQNRLAEAQLILEQCLSLIQDLSTKWSQATALNFLGRVTIAQGNFEQALMYLTESLRLYQSLQIEADIAPVMESFAALAFAKNRPTRAVELYALAETLRTRGHILASHYDQVIKADHLTMLRIQLGEEAFQSAWKRGESEKIEHPFRFID